MQPDVSIVIVTWNGRRHLDVCLGAVAAQVGVSAETIVVDNALPNLQATTVYIARESGGRQMLGSVESGRKQTFTYTAGNGVYTLSARLGAGQQDIISEKVQLSGSTTLTWRLPANVVITGN